MSAHTKKHPIKKSTNGEYPIIVVRSSESHVDSLPIESKSTGKNWREVFKDVIKKKTEQGIALRGYRLREGFTQKCLADELSKYGLSVSQHHISEMENGKRSIGKNLAHVLATILKSDYKDFL